MIRVVLADDHPFMRTGVQAVLAAQGMAVVAAVDDGPAALAAIRRETPDVAVLDVRMPQLDGVAVLQALRAENCAVPVILLAAEIEDAALLAANQAGVEGIVFKAGAETVLASAIQAVLSGQRFIDAATRERIERLIRITPLPRPADLLTPRELQIAAGVTEGLRNREIAAHLGMAEGSVKVYLNRIYDKLGVENRTELAVTMLGQTRAG